MGVSIQKELMPSIANTVGTNMRTYKILKKRQFAYGPVTSRNGDKISVALLEDYDEVIISQAYTSFEIINIDKLLPEYLMMWFRRPEFDRYARFMSHGSAREVFGWEELCNTKLPVPSIETQRAIVIEYNTVKNRIALNNQLIQKLEETAQTIYKQWFVDFEFPDENGQPYKSSGGKMVFNEELNKEVPEGWEHLDIQELISRQIIFKNQDGNHGEIHPRSSDFVEEGVPFLMAKDIINGFVNIHSCKNISKQQADKLRIKPAKGGDVLLTHKATMGRVAIVPEDIGEVVLTPQVTYYRPRDLDKINKEFLFYLFNSFDFKTQLTGYSEQSTRSFLSITNQRYLKVLFPNKIPIKLFKAKVEGVLEHKKNINNSTIKLLDLLEIILSKLAII
jgi:type I restriction enzyme S subunit